MAITTSTAYDGESCSPCPCASPCAVQEQIPADITVSVDGTDITVPAIFFDGHYYLTVDGMNALLGTNATIQEKGRLIPAPSHVPRRHCRRGNFLCYNDRDTSEERM